MWEHNREVTCIDVPGGEVSGPSIACLARPAAQVRVGIKLVAERGDVGCIVVFTWLLQVDCGKCGCRRDNPVEVRFVRHVLVKHKDLEVDPCPVHEARNLVDAESARRT